MFYINLGIAVFKIFQNKLKFQINKRRAYIYSGLHIEYKIKTYFLLDSKNVLAYKKISNKQESYRRINGSQINRVFFLTSIVESSFGFEPKDCYCWALVKAMNSIAFPLITRS